MNDDLKNLFDQERTFFLGYVQNRIASISSSMLNLESKMYLYGLLVSLTDLCNQRIDSCCYTAGISDLCSKKLESIENYAKV